MKTEKSEVITENEINNSDVSSFGGSYYKHEYDRLMQKKLRQREKNRKLTLILGIAMFFTASIVCVSIAFVACIISTAYVKKTPSDSGNGMLGASDSASCTMSPYENVKHGALDKIVQISSERGGQLSGVVITSDGYILTSASEELKNGTLTVNGKHNADFIGMDSNSGIAILKMNVTDTKAAELGKSESLPCNSDVYVVYSKNGENITVKGTVYHGAHGSFGINGVSFENHMYGGAVFDINGRVVGIITGGRGNFANVMSSSSALPLVSQYVRGVWSKDISYGSARVDTLGISVMSVSDAESEKFGLPGGLLIIKCDENALGYKAGLQLNDIIIGVESFAVENADELTELLEHHSGETVSLLVYRNEKYINIGVDIDA